VRHRCWWFLQILACAGDVYVWKYPIGRHCC
jgi:hypothetical protein